MKISGRRYCSCLLLQLSFLAIDLVFNCVTLFPRSRETFFILFTFQNLFIIFAIAAILITFFSTYLFQAGLVEFLLSKFRNLLIVSVSYLVASILLHVCWLAEKWNSPSAVSTSILIVLLVVQRCLSPWYYFFYKRAALRLSDPRFYEDIDWINQQLRTE